MPGDITGILHVRGQGVRCRRRIALGNCGVAGEKSISADCRSIASFLLSGPRPEMASPEASPTPGDSNDPSAGVLSLATMGGLAFVGLAIMSCLILALLRYSRIQGFISASLPSYRSSYLDLPAYVSQEALVAETPPPSYNMDELSLAIPQAAQQRAQLTPTSSIRPGTPGSRRSWRVSGL
ncbi:uncharacterized protein BJ171DRAFT_224787 [Polychytrium aggregatum]|uniref:uncharacterized protein n=1 Tax=Polychytrium aggregatum TaxID=110093 RepID=UPI0022FEE508|nr:uncharacterized protein BJ171DRAFT_224787 [Polychytrium aggregatum]KAI9197272.1 hypothetical protein BJ171DRAFT_224787 [Polychytrium aggregatum]